jgi:DNA-binding GntR family transcriptional regulator
VTDASIDPSLVSRLREAILSLELAPGQSLSERGLEPLFGASRTPIRSALSRLEAEGLVRRDGKGWMVTPIDVDEIRSLYEFREILEVAGIRLASIRATPEERAALARLVSEADSSETPEHSMDAGTSFHLEVARLSGNRFLHSAMESILTRLYRTRWLEVQTAESRERAHREHEDLVAALIAEDDVSAEAAMLDHLRATGARLLDSLASSRMALKASGIAVLASPRRD